MYKYFISLCILIAWIQGSGIFASQDQLPNNILELQPLIEKHSKLEQLNIYNQIPFTFFKKTLELYCPTISIQEAKHISSHFLPERENKTLTTRTINQIEKDFLRLKENYIQIHNIDTKIFCKQKYLTLMFLESTQNYFHNIKNKLDRSSLKTNTTPNKHNKTPIQLETINTSKQPVQTEHNSAQKNQVTILHNTKNLKTQELLSIKQQTENFIQNIIWDMMRKGILLEQDRKRLDGKIEINYLQECNPSRWSFHLLLDSQYKNHLFKWIKIQLNLCNKTPSSQQLWKHIQHLLGHELGHYISFFRDPSFNSFSQICRKEKKNICNNSDFNSAYAQTNSDEDYAESFAYRYRYLENTKTHNSPSSEKLQQKEEHFNKLFF